MSDINYSRQEQFSKLQVIKSKWRRKLGTLLSIISWLIQHSWPVRPAPPSPPQTENSVQTAFSPRIKLQSPLSERRVLTQRILWAGPKRQNRTSGNGLPRKMKIPHYERHVTHRTALHGHLPTVTEREHLDKAARISWGCRKALWIDTSLFRHFWDLHVAIWYQFINVAWMFEKSVKSPRGQNALFVHLLVHVY